MITFNKSDFDTILEYAKKNLPEEACGLIGGTIENGDKHIKKIYLLTNIDHSNEHFSMDPKEQLAAVKDMRANGLVPTGIHIQSHHQDHLMRIRDLHMTAKQVI